MHRIDTLRIVSTVVVLTVFSVLAAASLGSEPKGGAAVEPVAAPPAPAPSRDGFYGTWHGHFDGENWTLRVTETHIVLGGVFGEMPTRYTVRSQVGGRLEVDQQLPEGWISAVLRLSEDGSRLTFSSDAEGPMTFARAAPEGPEASGLPSGATQAIEAARAAIAAHDLDALGGLLAPRGHYELGGGSVATRREAALEGLRARPEALPLLERAFARACEAEPPEDGQIFVTCGRSGVHGALTVTLSNLEGDETFVIVDIGETR